MAALNFPSSPFLNQVFTANGKSWRYDGTSWKTFYVLGVPSGGTGNTSYNLGDILVGAGTSMFALPIGSNGYVLTSDNTAPFLVSWQPTSAAGITTLNGITSGLQYFAIGTSGTGFNISSSGSTHTFNIPIAGSGSTGLVSTLAQTFAGEKTFSSSLAVTDSTTSTSTSTGALKVTGGVGIGGSLFVSSSSNLSGVVINTGVITTGAWAGSTITSLYGGTGQNTYTKGDLLAGTGATLSVLSVGSNDYILAADSSAATGLTWKAAASAGTTVIGTPSDGVYTDGFFTDWTTNTTIANAFDDVSELLALIAPAKPGTLSGTALTTTSVPTYYNTAAISAGLGTEWYQAGFGTGSTITRYYLSGAHTLTTANTTTAFYAGTLVTSTYGTLGFGRYNYLSPNGAGYGTIDMTVNYTVGSTNNNLRLSDLAVYNNIWTKANAQISAYTQTYAGYEGVYITHSTNSQVTNTYNMWKDPWSAANPNPTFSKAATASTTSQTLKYLSGISYYTTGTGFSVDFKGAAGIYSSCYNVTRVYRITATGLIAINGTVSSPLFSDELDKTGVNAVSATLNSPSAASFTKSITATIYKAHETTAANQAAIAKYINTYTTTSTDTFEGFQDEARRLVIDTGIGFTSNIDMANGNLQVRSGTLIYPQTAEYDAEYGGSHTFSGNQEYQRYFYKTSASTGTLTFVGLVGAAVSAYGSGSLNILMYLEGDNKYFDLGTLQGSNANDGSTRSLAISAKTSVSAGALNWSLGTNTTGVAGAGNSGRYRLIVIYKNSNPQITSITSS